jgi:hypothetical protein
MGRAPDLAHQTPDVCRPLPASCCTTSAHGASWPGAVQYRAAGARDIGDGRNVRSGSRRRAGARFVAVGRAWGARADPTIETGRPRRGT